MTPDFFIGYKKTFLIHLGKELVLTQTQPSYCCSMPSNQNLFFIQELLLYHLTSLAVSRGLLIKNYFPYKDCLALAIIMPYLLTRRLTCGLDRENRIEYPPFSILLTIIIFNFILAECYFIF